VSLLAAALHLSFWSALDWPRALAGLPGDQAATVQTLNATLAYVRVAFAYVSLVHAGEMLAPGLGRMTCTGLAFFWALRAATGVLFYGFSPVEVLLYLAVAALYAVPLIGSGAGLGADGRASPEARRRPRGGPLV
jgi:hypothetical protein